MVATKADKFNPYHEFKLWLNNPAPQVPLKEEVIKAINKRAVLGSLGTYGGVTIFLNEWFNTYDMMELDDMEFYRFIKDIIQKFKVNVYKDFSYFKSEKKDKQLAEIHKYFPYLKKEEVSLLLDIIKEDEEYDQFMDYIGLKKYKKIKTPKEKKKSKKMSIISFNDLKKVIGGIS